MPTKISWTNEVLNVFAGCSPCSIGCAHCYAKSFAHRFDTNIGTPQFLGKTDGKGNWTGKLEFCPWMFEKLKHWRKPRFIFVNSMSDTFYEKVETVWLEILIAKITAYQQHTFQILTKRAKLMCEYGADGVLNLPNLRLGISVCNQAEADEKIPYLQKTYASFRFISFEPLFSSIIYTFRKIDQIIIGCESINGRVGRLNDGNGDWSNEKVWLDWATNLVRQAKEANVMIFVKQIPLNGKVCKDIKKFPKELQYQEM